MTDGLPMTEQKPKTLALSTHEWKGLVLLNIAQMHEWVSKKAEAEGLTREERGALAQHMDRVNAMLGAWAAASAPPQQVPEAQEQSAAAAQANGAEPTKKRGGWPKGKKRTPQPQPETVQ